MCQVITVAPEKRPETGEMWRYRLSVGRVDHSSHCWNSRPTCRPSATFGRGTAEEWIDFYVAELKLPLNPQGGARDQGFGAFVDGPYRPIIRGMWWRRGSTGRRSDHNRNGSRCRYIRI